MAREREGEADTLLVDLVPRPEDPVRSEDIWAVVAVYRESGFELDYCISGLTQNGGDPSMRIIIFVDGAQGSGLFQQAVGEGGAAVHNAMLAARSALARGLPLPEPWGDDSLGALLHLAGLLSLGAPAVAHGCLLFTGVSPHGAPFEVYVKGPAVPRTKRVSHAMALSLLAGDEKAGRPLPRALLLVDGDCRSEPGTVGRMFSCLVDQGLGGATPCLLPERRAESTALVWQTVRNFGVSGLTWGSQSCFGFQHPAGGAFVMFSTGALRACTEEYCRACSPASIWDCLRIDSGEDSYLTNLVLEQGFKVRHLLHCHATTFMPETWLEYLAQQARWKRSHLGNRSDILLCRRRAWAGFQAVHWLFELLECFFRGEFLGVGVIVFLFAKISGPPLRQLAEGICNFHGEVLPEDSVELATMGVLWLALSLYAVSAAGRPISDLPTVHRVAMGLAALLPASQLTLTVAYWQAHRYWQFWALQLAPAAFVSLARLPHGVRAPWAALALPLALPLVYGIENALAPLLGVANADASATLGWGTRQGTGEHAALARLEDQGREQRARARRRLLAGWLLANGLLGLLLEALCRRVAVLKGMLAFVAARMVLDMILCSWYSAWLHFSTARGSEAKTADDRIALMESESKVCGA